MYVCMGCYAHGWLCCLCSYVCDMVLVLSLSFRKVYIAYGTAGYVLYDRFDRRSLYLITGSIVTGIGYGVLV
jgi:hypothetical protein